MNAERGLATEQNISLVLDKSMADSISEINDPHNLSQVSGDYLARKKEVVSNELKVKSLADKARELTEKGKWKPSAPSILEKGLIGEPTALQPQEIDIPVKKEPETAKPNLTQEEINYLQTNPPIGSNRKDVEHTRFMGRIGSLFNKILKIEPEKEESSPANVQPKENFSKRETAEISRLKKTQEVSIEGYRNLYGGQSPEEVVLSKRKTQESPAISTKTITGSGPLIDATVEAEKKPSTQS